MRTVCFRSAGLVAILVLATCSQTQAMLITFDDLSGDRLPIPNGYGALNWNNFYYLDGVHYGGNTGYTTGVVSPNNVAFNANALPAEMYVSSISPFDLNSCYLTSAWNDNNHVTITGSRSGTAVYNTVVTTNTSGPIFVTLDWQDVDKVRFSSDSAHFAMDNLTINQTSAPIPEPVSLVSGLIGLGCIGGYLRHRRGPA